MNLFKFKNGFSIVELLVYGLIIASVSVIFVAIWISFSRLFSNQITNIYLAEQNELALNDMTNQIRDSFEVVDDCLIATCDPTCGNNCKDGEGNTIAWITTIPEVTSQNVLILSLWPLDNNNKPFDPASTGVGFDYIIYKLDGANNLIRETHTMAILPFSGNVRSTRLPDCGTDWACHESDIIASDVRSFPSPPPGYSSPPPDLEFKYFDINNNDISSAPYTNACGVQFSVTNSKSDLNKEFAFPAVTKSLLKNKSGCVYQLSNINFNFAVQSGSGDISMHPGSVINGDAHSNLYIRHSGGDPTGVINAVSVASAIKDIDVEVDPPEFARPFSPTPVSLPTVDANFWKQAAEDRNITTCSGTKFLTTGTMLGKYTCNVTILDEQTVTITGPVWIEGRFHLGNTDSATSATQLQLDTTQCLTGTVIMGGSGNSDDMRIRGASQIISSGSKYILLYPQQGLFKFEGFNDTGSAIIYAPNSEVTLIGSLTGAIAADKVVITSDSSITYDANLAAAKFSTCE